MITGSTISLCVAAPTDRSELGNTVKMSGEISPNVAYLISQLDGKGENRLQVNISYSGVKMEGGGSEFPLELTKERPTIDIGQMDEPHRKKHYKTLVREREREREKIFRWVLFCLMFQIFIDPDAPSGAEPLTGPFLHWIVTNIAGDDATDGDEICETNDGETSDETREMRVFRFVP